MIDKPLHISGTCKDQYVNHPVDPLVSKVRRGVLISMFPYPIVDSGQAVEAYEIKKNREGSVFVAVPVWKVKYDKDAMLARLVELKPGISKSKDQKLPLKDRAYLILHILRAVISIRNFIRGVPGELRLEAELKAIHGFDQLRLAAKGHAADIDLQLLCGLTEIAERMLNDAEEKIRGEVESRVPENTGTGASGIIL
ncbi:MAG: hypothetical protein PHQ23_04580 [Candidatus Wallbacteria bacterium]|nr:hypothetical protein [Candidatus Wallbacteria bacterium]